MHKIEYMEKIKITISAHKGLLLWSSTKKKEALLTQSSSKARDLSFQVETLKTKEKPVTYSIFVHKQNIVHP
jgi:hypothetical protein